MVPLNVEKTIRKKYESTLFARLAIRAFLRKFVYGGMPELKVTVEIVRLFVGVLTYNLARKYSELLLPKLKRTENRNYFITVQVECQLTDPTF